jgi:rubrerythrin
MFYTHLQKACPTEIKDICIKAGYPFKQKWDLVENLRIAAEDENNEACKIYTEFEKTAKEEGFHDIAKLFKDIIQVEHCHKMLFQQLHDQLKNGTMYKKPNPVKWKCADCGYEATAKEAWTTCPLCEAKQGAVMLHIEDNV